MKEHSAKEANPSDRSAAQRVIQNQACSKCAASFAKKEKKPVSQCSGEREMIDASSQVQKGASTQLMADSYAAKTQHSIHKMAHSIQRKHNTAYAKT